MRITANNGKQVFESYSFLGGNIDRIVIYGNGEKYLQMDGGKFEPHTIKENKYGNKELSGAGWGYSVQQIDLTGEIKRANKENLNRKDNYLLRYKSDRVWCNTALYALYINVAECDVFDLGEIVAMQTDDETNYRKAYKLTFKNPVTIRDAVFERIICDSFEFPENARVGDGVGTVENPVYEYFDTSDYVSMFNKKNGTDRQPVKGVLKKYWKYEKISEPMIIPVGCYCRMETSDKRKEQDRLAKIISSALKHSFSHYDIERLQKVVNITVRGE